MFLQGGALGDLGRVLDAFGHPHLEHLPLFVHIDLVAGLENNEAGIEYLADFNSISGVVTVHHHLCGSSAAVGLAIDRSVVFVRQPGGGPRSVGGQKVAPRRRRNSSGRRCGKSGQATLPITIFRELPAVFVEPKPM